MFYLGEQHFRINEFMNVYLRFAHIPLSYSLGNSRILRWIGWYNLKEILGNLVKILSCVYVCDGDRSAACHMCGEALCPCGYHQVKRGFFTTMSQSYPQILQLLMTNWIIRCSLHIDLLFFWGSKNLKCYSHFLL